MFDKTAKTEMRRLFLSEGLPEPLTPMSSHVQLFDNYIENTRLRLRSIRDPQTKEWTRVLQQKFPAGSDLSTWKLAEIYLNEAEYQVFERFEGREIRKNRYFHDFDGHPLIFDVHIGALWGLCTVKVEFEHADTMKNFTPPPFCIFEVTEDPFFAGSNLVGKTFDDIRAKVEKLEAVNPYVPRAAAE
jgi:CYTH domain-containing protein